MKLKVVNQQYCVGCQCCMFACSRRDGNGGLDNSCIGIKSAGGMSKGFKVIVCRACDDAPCARACPTGALTQKKGGGVKLDKSKCNGCGNCVKACMIGAVYWNEHENKPRFCIQCGICAQFCPHNVLELVKGE